MNIGIVVADKIRRSSLMMRRKVAMNDVRMVAVVVVPEMNVLRRQRCQREHAQNGVDREDPLENATEHQEPIILPKAESGRPRESLVGRGPFRRRILADSFEPGLTRIDGWVCN